MLPNQLSWFQISIQKTKILKQENSQQSQSPGWITFDGGVGTIRFSFCWAAHFCACSAKKIQEYLSSFGGSGLSVPPVYYITVQPCWFSAEHNWRASPNAWNVVQLLVQTWILFFCLFIVFNSYSFMLYTVDLTIPLTLFWVAGLLAASSAWQVWSKISTAMLLYKPFIIPFLHIPRVHSQSPCWLFLSEKIFLQSSWKVCSQTCLPLSTTMHKYADIWHTKLEICSQGDQDGKTLSSQFSRHGQYPCHWACFRQSWLFLQC